MYLNSEVYNDGEVDVIDESDHVQVYSQGHEEIEVDVTGKSDYILQHTSSLKHIHQLII